MTYEPRQLLQAIKMAAGRPGPQWVIPVGNPAFAWLRPVATAPELQDPQDVTRMTQWRNKFKTSFLHEFEANDERTAKWLAQTIGPDDTQIMFMIDDLGGRTFGQAGVAFINWDTRSGEANAILRGEEAPRGAMTAALKTLLNWARGYLGLQTLTVRVRSDNPACEFYRKMGFVEFKRVPLRQMIRPDGPQWVEAPDEAPGGLCIVYMKLADGEGQ